MPAKKNPPSAPKDHTLLWAIGLAAGVFTFCYTIVLPIYEKHAMNQIAEQKEQLEKAAEEKKDYIEQLGQLAKDNADLRKTLQELRPGFFSQGSPYPSGWEGVKMGSSLAMLEAVYPEKSFTSEPAEDGGYVSISPKLPQKGAAIVSAAYYYDEDSSIKKVRSILFHSSREVKIKALEPEELIKVFGRTGMQRKETKRSLKLTWKDAQGITVEFEYDLIPSLGPQNPRIVLRDW